MNRFLLYMLLAGSPLTLSAQTDADTVNLTETFTVSYEDSIAVSEDAAVYKDRRFGKEFKEKYTGPEFQYEAKTAAKSWWDRFLEALIRFLDRLFSVGGKAGGSTAMDILLKIVALAVVGFAIYLIVRAVLNKQSLWIFGRSRKNIDVSEISEQDLQQMDFPNLVKQAAAEGQHNLAIRYYFLWVLKKLADREIIDWHWDKTNSDYLYEIKNSATRRDFEYLAYVYDYAWYGNFLIDDAAFAKAEKAFQKTLNTL